MSGAVFLVEPGDRPLGAKGALFRNSATRLKTELEIRDVLDSSKPALLVVTTRLSLKLLSSSIRGRVGGNQRLLAIGGAETGNHALLHATFRHVLSAEEGLSLLAPRELAEVLASPDPSDLLVGAMTSQDMKKVIVYRGNAEPLVVPSEWFSLRPALVKPNLTDVSVIDCGLGLRLGEYETSTDAILYEFDRDYRRRARKRQIEIDTSFGGCVRRLRLQRGLTQRQIAGVTDKEIARIERGEVTKPHKRTLELLGKALGVKPDEIESY